MVTWVVALLYGPVVCLVDLPVTLHFSACRWRPREICVGDFEVVLYDVQMQVSSRHWRWSTGWNIQWGWSRGSGLRSCHCSLSCKTGCTSSNCGDICSPFSRSKISSSCGRSNSWSWRGDCEEGCSGHYAEADGCIGEGWGPPSLSTWGQRDSRHALCSASSGKGGH